MMSLLAVASLLAGLVIGATTLSAEDEAGTDTARVASELAGIRGELRTIAQLLGTVEEHHRVTALMTRIQLKQQRLSSVEGQLHSARAEQEAVEQEIERLAVVERTWADRPGDDATDERLKAEEERQLELMRQQRKSLESRVETLRMRIVELDNDLARVRKEILALEETVDEQLGLR